jgi:site-specific DNA-methyltransferase (adenine-specific)
MEKFKNKICHGKNLDLLVRIPKNSIDLWITSPPYKEEDGYNSYLMGLIAIESFRTLKDNSLFFLNFGHLSDNKHRPFTVCNYGRSAGFELNDTIIWVKNHYTPLNGKKHLNNLTEFIFLLNKGEMPDLDRLSIGIPYKDKSNIGRYSNKDLKCGGNVWYIDIPTITKKTQRLHKDEFPEELPLRCIKLSGLKKGVVIDPFSGSFTTQIAAQRLGLDWLGVDSNYDNCQIAQERFLKEFNKKVEIINL